MLQAMTLEELKTAVLKLRHRVIRRDGENAWCPLVNWNGFVPTKNARVNYYLVGDKVRATRVHEEEEQWFTLS